MLKQLPNALTLTRLVLAPVVALAVWQTYATSADAASAQQTWALLAVGLFVFAALTDLVDGWAARLLNADSKFGRIIDPIADKALVGLPLIAVTLVAWQVGQPLWWLIALATAIIVLRDALMTTLRLMSADGEGVRVSNLAKWKTAVELIAVGLPILMVAAPSIAKMTGLSEGFSGGPVAMFLWLALLVTASVLSAVTAVQYLSAKPAAAEPTIEAAPEPTALEPETAPGAVAEEILKRLP
jgi:cardiolipin synthase (CMP-forming)